MVSKKLGLLLCLVLTLILCALSVSCFGAFGDENAESATGGASETETPCKHSFGAYEYPEDADCRRPCAAVATCALCGQKAYESRESGPHIYGGDKHCIYCGLLDMKVGVEYREGDFIYCLRSKNRCEAILAEDVTAETVSFPSSYGGHDISVITMPSSESIRKSVKHVYIPASVETTSLYAFKDCVALETVSIENGCKLTSVGYEAFAGCSSLLSIELENCIALTEIGARAFEDCSSLKEITLPSTVTMVEERAFSGCSSLENVRFESEYVGLGVGVFIDCTSLSNVNFLNKVETIPGSAFAGCTGLERIRIPDNVKIIEDYAFEDCGLIEVALSHSLTSLGNMAFFNCKSLRRIEIYDGIKKISTSTFSGCKALCEVILPSTLEEIAPSAFASCESLERIVIPASVKSLAANAFSLDNALTEVIFERTEGWVKGNEPIDAQTLADPALAAKLLREGVTSEFFLIP